MSDWELKKELEKMEKLLWLLEAQIQALNVRVSRLEREVFHKHYPRTSGIVVQSR